MRFQLYLLIGICLFAVGCNADPRCRRETALLRAEILDLEDKYYLTKSQRDDALVALRGDDKIDIAKKIAARNPDLGPPVSNEVYYGDVIYDGDVIYEGGVPGSSGEPTVSSQPYDYAPYQFESAPNVPAAADSDPYREESFQLDFTSPEVIDPLETSRPGDGNPSGSLDVAPPGSPARDALPEPKKIPADSASKLMLNDSRSSLSRRQPENRSRDGRLVTEIVIDGTQTRGHDVDGQPGDEGINLLVQPKSATGETILQAGELTVSVIDPAAPSATQRIGFWKFVAAETELFFKQGDSSADGPESRGILLHLPWEKAFPHSNQVVVFVRFETSDGRRLETTAKVNIKPPTGPFPSQRSDDDLIAAWMEPNEMGTSNSGVTNRNRVPAQPASSHSPQGSRPSWRPVR